MGELTKDPNVLMRRWMELYINLNVLRSSDPGLERILRDMKDKLAEVNEHLMRFFDAVGADPEAEG